MMPVLAATAVYGLPSYLLVASLSIGSSHRRPQRSPAATSHRSSIQRATSSCSTSAMTRA